MKFNYQGKDITLDKLRKRVGVDVVNYVVKESIHHDCIKFHLYIDSFHNGVLIVTNTEA